MEKKFINLREKFCKKLEKITIKSNLNCWNFYINSTPENLAIYEKSQDEYSNLFKDKDLYNEFLKIDKNLLQKPEKKQLKNLLKEFELELNTGDDLKQLRKKENEIAQKFNSYIPKIDNQEISKAKIVEIMQKEENIDIRQKAYNARITGGDLIAEDLISFIKMRNNFAKKKGFNNYFEYKLIDEYEVEIDFLKNLINEVYTKTKNKIKEIQNKKQKELKEFFNEECLKPYHYGLLLNSNPEKDVNDILKDYDIVEISKNIYNNMGYDIEKLIEEKKLTLDLYPRKGKNTHGFCFDIEAGKDARILANLINNIVSLDTLNHEMGHCVYDLGISTSLTFLDRTAASPAFTEAIAMMMGDNIKIENTLDKIVPSNLLLNLKNTQKEDEINFVSKSLLIIDFEREIYSNPKQNPAELWRNLKKKYLNRDEEADNEWATIPHYLSHPAYYQNYFRANLMKVQIYNYLKSQLGNLTENKNSADFMNKNIFEYGASIDEYDLIEKLTGKKFSAEDFINRVNA